MDITQYKQIIQAALLADSHAMSLHWNYEAENIAELIKSKKIDLDILNSGEESNYFKGKESGDQSHHGDQIVHLYKYLQTNPKFDMEKYAIEWKAYLDDYKYYIDRSSINAFEKLAFNIPPYGADSSDFCGVTMGLPTIIEALDNVEKAIELAKERTSMTHNNTLALDCAQWFITALYAVSEGSSIIIAMDLATDSINNPVFKTIYQKGKEFAKRKESMAELTTEIGKGCDITTGLPALCILLERHQNNYLDFIKANTETGGDTTSRAIIGGALIGANSNLTLPEDLLAQLKFKV